MKKNKRFWIHPLAVMGLFIMLITACEKDDNPTPTQLTDIDGNVYTTVTIGTQVWMVENLKTTKYNDGTEIPLITDYTEWSNLTTPSYCWYDNEKTTYKNRCGALYNWHSVKTEKLCPSGWHVPSDAEWTTLTDYLGGESEAGGKLKETGTTHWNNPNTGATNETGFTARPGGYRVQNGTFHHIEDFGYWWSSTEEWDEFSSIYLPLIRGMYSSKIYVRSLNSNKESGHSVRCLKD